MHEKEKKTGRTSVHHEIFFKRERERKSVKERERKTSVHAYTCVRECVRKESARDGENECERCSGSSVFKKKVRNLISLQYYYRALML